MLTDESDDLGRPLRSPAAAWRRAPFLSPLSLGGRAVMSLGWMKLQRSPKEQFSGSLLLTIGSKRRRKKVNVRHRALARVSPWMAGVQLPKSSHPGRANICLLFVCSSLLKVHVLSVHAALSCISHRFLIFVFLCE